MLTRLPIIALLSGSVLQAQAPRSRKIFISVDMEGITAKLLQVLTSLELPSAMTED